MELSEFANRTNEADKPEIDAVYVANLIDRYVWGRHAERNRKILKRRLIDGITYEPLAEEFGLSVRHVKSIVYRNQEAVFDHIYK